MTCPCAHRRNPLEEFGSSAPAGALDLASRYLAFLWWLSTRKAGGLEIA